MSIRCFGTGVGVDRVVVAVLLVIVGATLSEAKIVAEFEDPVENKVVSGIGIVRGWAASDVAGVKIQRVTLLLDEQPIVISGKPLEIPCCSLRGDVASGRGDIPKENALHSGFGFTLNYAVLTEGPHKLTIQIEDSSGTQHSITHAITVVSVAGIKFFDQFDLSAAKVEKQGQEVQVTDVCVRDKENVQVTKKVSTRWRWSTTTQGIELIATTPQEGTCAVLPPPARNTPPPTAPPIVALLESPEQAQAVAGIGVIRGWAFATQGRRIQKVQLFVDPLPDPLEIPYGSVRGDVAQGHPNEPGALNSGFGIALNYGELEAGNHRVTVRIEDTAGNKQELRSEVIVKRIGEFRYVKEVTLEETGKVEVQGGKLIIDGMIVRDHYSDLSRHRILQYGFDVSAQGLLLREDADKNIGVGNCNCNVNGDTANLAALQSNPGADGISLPEFIQAANNTTNTERFSAAIIGPPDPCRVTCSQALPTLTRSNVALDGDSNGDGVPNVTIVGSGITASASNVTIRGFRFEGVPTAAVQVVAPPGVSLTDVAILGNESRGPVGDAAQEQVGVLVSAQAEPEKPSHISRVLIHANLLSGGRRGVYLRTTGTNATSPSNNPDMSHINILSNTIMGTNGDGVRVGSEGATRTLLDQILIEGNTIRDAKQWGIAATGGIRSSQNRIEVAVVKNHINGTVPDRGLESIALVGSEEEASDNVIKGELRENRIDNDRGKFGGVLLLGGERGGLRNRVDGKVNRNIITNARGDGGIIVAGGFTRAQDNTVEASIENNLVQNSAFNGIHLRGGTEADSNTVQATVANNTVVNTQQDGISVFGGHATESGGSQKNIVMGTIQANEIQRSGEHGIVLWGGHLGQSQDNMIEAEVTRNIITNTGTDGVAIYGSDGATENTVMGRIAGNIIQAVQRGVLVAGGYRADTNVTAGAATVDTTVVQNQITDVDKQGIAIIGGIASADNNLVTGTIQQNQIQDSNEEGIFLSGGISSSGNMVVDTTVSDNQVRTTQSSGIGVFGGTTRPIQNSSGPARGNTVRGVLRRNTVENSTTNDILVLGGSDDELGEVVGNLAEQVLEANNVDPERVFCDDGITGNKATCRSGSGVLAFQGGRLKREQRSVAIQTIPVLEAHKLVNHADRLLGQEQEVRHRAETVQNKDLKSDLLNMSERLSRLRQRMLATMVK